MKSAFLLATVFFLLTSPLLAQVYYEQKPEDVDKVSICTWPKIAIYAEPGEGNEVLTYALFGEELRHLGEEGLVRQERNNYILIESQDGSRGWVNDQYLVRNAGLVVMLENARVFNKPSAYSTSSGLRFYAGELAILSDWQENWIYLTGEKGRIFGWVEGYERLSVNPQDIEIGGMLRKALMIPSPADQAIALRSIADTPEYAGSPVRDIVQDVIVQLNDPRPTVMVDQGNGTSTQNPTPAPQQDSSYQEVIQYDESNQPFIQVQEIGGVQPVKAKNPPSIYYAYHKSVPIGDKILLQIPGNQGFVELSVVARLRASNPNVVGLGQEVIKKVLGANQATEIGRVTILYPKPE